MRIAVMRDIVLISDARVAAIPVEESGERLVDVRGRLRTDGRLADLMCPPESGEAASSVSKRWARCFQLSV